jgi:glucose 1-dehydrogenase
MSSSLTLITGGTRGIGAATARKLAAAGHDLVLGYHRDEQAAAGMVAEIQALGRRCVAVRADLGTPDGVDAPYAPAAEVGRLPAVVNNAGATLLDAPLAETPVDIIRRTIDLNLTGAVLVARAAVRTLGRSYGGDGGVIVNVSSAAATLGSPDEYVSYAAAKAGVDTLTLGLAKEVGGDGIRVVGISPGLIRTEIHASAGDAGRLDRLSPGVPLGRAGEPEEIADAIAWAVGDAASYVTGTTIRVSGGR